MTLAELVGAVRNGHAYARIDDAYLHRAVREDGGDVIRGRDAIRDAEMAAAAGPVSIAADLGDMIAWRGEADAGHHWIWRSGDRILRDVVIRDGGTARASATPLHPPLGELRPGRGQLAAGDDPDLPPGWPDAAIPHAARLHRIWNARAFDLIADHAWRGPAGRAGETAQHRAWLAGLLAALPDAVLLFEHAIVTERAVALLWRVHGHHLGDGFGLPATGRRVRAAGSTLLALAGDAVVSEETLIDEAAIRAGLVRPLVDYSG